MAFKLIIFYRFEGCLGNSLPFALSWGFCVVVESGFHNSLSILGLPGSEAELLSLVEHREALGVLVQPREGPALVIRFDAFHFNNFGSRENISELDRGPSLFLILYDLQNCLFHGVSLSDSFVIRITLVSVLVTTYKCIICQ